MFVHIVAASGFSCRHLSGQGGGVSKFSLLARLGWVSAICNQEVMTAIIEPALFLHCYSYVCDHFFSV